MKVLLSEYFVLQEIAGDRPYRTTRELPRSTVDLAGATALRFSEECRFWLGCTQICGASHVSHP